MIAVIETGSADKALKYIDEILKNDVFNGIKVTEIYLREKTLDDDTYTVLTNLVGKLIIRNQVNNKEVINQSGRFGGNESTDEFTHVKFAVSYRDGLGYSLPADTVHFSFSDFIKCDYFPVNTTKSVSVHSIEEAMLAEKNGADRLMTGHIFATQCKNTDPRGLEFLSDIVRTVQIPVVAIGGITIDNYLKVIKIGASDIAVMNSWRKTS